MKVKESALSTEAHELLNELESASSALSWIGSQDIREREGIKLAYDLARQNINNYIIKLENQK